MELIRRMVVCQLKFLQLYGKNKAICKLDYCQRRRTDRPLQQFPAFRHNFLGFEKMRV